MYDDTSNKLASSLRSKRMDVQPDSKNLADDLLNWRKDWNTPQTDNVERREHPTNALVKSDGTPVQITQPPFKFNNVDLIQRMRYKFFIFCVMHLKIYMNVCFVNVVKLD